ncbi:MAG: CBS domain-containing protein [cyanobacterium endosymbiont of Rhopalodia gibba]
MTKHEKKIHKVLGQTIGEIMTSKPISVQFSQSLREAAYIMHNKKIGSLPVVNNEGDKVIGLLTQQDIIRSIVQH